jgi:hypothetical protein
MKNHYYIVMLGSILAVSILSTVFKEQALAVTGSSGQPPDPNPKTYSNGAQVVGGKTSGQYIDTSVVLSDSGRLDITTTTTTHEKMAGFEGGTVVILSDSAGNILYTTPLLAYGVDGEWTGTHARTDYWHACNPFPSSSCQQPQLTPTIYQQTDNISIVHTITAKNGNDVMGWINKIGQAGKALTPLVSAISGAGSTSTGAASTAAT